MALRKQKQQVETKPKVNALISAAAAVKFDRTSWLDTKVTDEDWQKTAWRFYDITGELRYVANFIGNAISRCRIYAAQVDEQGRAADEASDQQVQLIAETMFGGPAERAEALRAIGIHLTVPGECFVVATSPEDQKDDQWYVVSAAELEKTPEGIVMNHGGVKTVLDEASDLIIRVWTPHPRLTSAADSPVRAVLPILTEIEQLTKHVFATIDSRLAGAGILGLPDEMEFPTDENETKAQSVGRKLTEAAGASLKDTDSAAALVPIVITAPGDTLKNIVHLKFDSQLTTETKDLRDAAIRRLALGMDIDPEVLLGMGDTNHWTAWQVEESTIKTQIEPVLGRIVDGLTQAYLRPALETVGLDPDAYTLWYDTSPLTVRPNRLTDAQNLYDRRAISATALLEAGAFDESDAPGKKEETERILLDLLDKQPTYAPAILSYLGIDVPGLAELAAPPAPEPAEPAPAPEDDQGQDGDNVRNLPEQQQESAPDEPADDTPQAAALLACDLLVMNALSRAGGKLLSRELRGRYQDVPKHELHAHVRVDERKLDWYLDGAWDMVPRIAVQLGMDPDRLRYTLDQYVKNLLRAGQPHEPDYLRQPVRSIGAA